jgi:hypothetical protein
MTSKEIAWLMRTRLWREQQPKLAAWRGAASVFRVVLSTVWTIFVAPFLLLVWRGVLDRGDVANHPGDWLMGWLDTVAKIPGVYPAALIATGILVGLWIDWLLRKIDGSRAARRKTLGTTYCSLSSNIEGRFGGYYGEWSENIHDLKPALMSAFIEAEGFGLWAPVDELYKRQDGGVVVVNHLRIVGTMLRDGHFKQARTRALQAKEFVAQLSKPATSP